MVHSTDQGLVKPFEDDELVTAPKKCTKKFVVYRVILRYSAAAKACNDGT